MKDFFGQELAIDDEVAFMEPHYRNMTLGTIISFAPQSMLLEWEKNFYGAKDGSKSTKMQFRATSQQVIKKPKD